LFQVGALTAFLDQAGMPLNHIKPHGMWVSPSEHGLRATSDPQYIVMQSDEQISDAAFRAMSHFKVPVYGLPNTLHEKMARKYEIPFVPEAFVDVNYDASGKLLGVPGSRKLTAEEIYAATKSLAIDGRIPAVDHTPIDVGVSNGPFTLCLHSDFKTCRENVKAARAAVDEANAKLYP
jgi:UPF0271 protein